MISTLFTNYLQFSLSAWLTGADEGITGTSTKKRAAFNRMIADAHLGMFQLILTKEVSRFSRNILDTISYTRELKSLGVGVVFVNDGINSLEPDAELRLAIMGSMAQEESRKTSSRVKWGQTRRMEQGVVFGRSLLGYDVKGGKITVNPEGAEIVRQIFYKYGVERKGTSVIARELREAGCKTVSGNPKWSNTYIIKVLKNEKYVGDLVQKKTVTPDYLSHARKYNHGEEELVSICGHHEPIIDRGLWDMVQEEMKKRNRKGDYGGGHSTRYVFSGKIKCGECGASFVSRKKYRKDGTGYRRWGCFTTTTEGIRHEDVQGNVVGCNIGKMLRDELAMDILKQSMASLQMDVDGIIRNVMNIAMESIRSTEGIVCEAKALQKDIEKKITAIVGGETDREVFYKNLLDHMVVFKDKRVEVHFNYLPYQWSFALEHETRTSDRGGMKPLCHNDSSVPREASVMFRLFSLRTSMTQ